MCKLKNFSHVTGKKIKKQRKQLPRYAALHINPTNVF